MKKIKKLVFATNNQHKLKEARQIISDGFEIVSLSDINCFDDIPETADTLNGNALIKARWVKEKYGFDCFADDTGLMVKALNGAPGVKSARYAGDHCNSSDNVSKLLKEMKNIENREAYFATVVALVADGEEHIFEGRVDGYISNEEHGQGGFGYDPVFIEKESGRCFAEMTSDEKNKVSHRGRAMRKLRDFLALFLIVVFSMLMSGKASAEQWRLHPSYDGQLITIADTPKYTYFMGTKQEYNPYSQFVNTIHGILFRYDKDGDEMKYLNSSNMLAGNTLKAMAYNYAGKYLAVAYDDGVIEFIYDDGTVKTIRGLMTAESSLDKNVNDFTFDNAKGKTYAATNFGYVTINQKNHEIDTSRIFNIKVNSAIIFKDLLWLGTDDGLYYGNPNEFSVSNFSKMLGGYNVSNLTSLGDKLYFTTGRGNALLVANLAYNDGKPTMTVISKGAERSFQRGEDVVISVVGSQIRVIDKNGSIEYLDLPSGYTNVDAGSRDGKTFWVSNGRKGISNMKAPGADGKWTVMKDSFFPNASSAFMCASMAYHPDYGMLVRNHGNEPSFTGLSNLTEDLISGYKDMNWSRLSTTYRTDMQGLLIDKPSGLAVDPKNSDHVYCGSTLTGFLRLDLKNPEKSIHFSKPSDILGGYGKPGFAVVVPDNPPGTWAEQCVFAAPSFDSYGNLWTTFVNPEPGYEASSYTEFWVWPAADRAATTSPSNVRGWRKIKIDRLISGNWPLLATLNYGSHKNFIVHSGGNVGESMIVYDHNGTIDNTSDDRYVKMKRLYDQDGNELSFIRAHVIYEDMNTGLVWVSYGDGVFTFNPSEAFTNPTSVRRIKVARNDGTNLADYLLSGVQINAITSDPSGRKWFATEGAGLVCTSSDGRQILASYTRDNSQLPGDNVYALCYNPSNGSMMISTDNGLCELFLEGTAQSDSSDVKIYPNPVRPDYYGYVTIEGLPQNAMVKIVDTAGNLIKECGEADNGVVEWDVTNMFFKKVPGGVYFVIASNGPNGDNYNKVGKILVVN